MATVLSIGHRYLFTGTLAPHFQTLRRKASNQEKIETRLDALGTFSIRSRIRRYIISSPRGKQDGNKGDRRQPLLPWKTTVESSSTAHARTKNVAPAQSDWLYRRRERNGSSSFISVNTARISTCVSEVHERIYAPPSYFQ